MSDKKQFVLLAGASGHIGSFLYNSLNKYYTITALGHSTKSIHKRFFSLDLTKVQQVKQFVEKIEKHDALIFLVGLAHKKGRAKEILDFRNVNTQSLIFLLNELKDKNKSPNKIIFASTISVYGEKIETNIYDENSEKNPCSPYAITKLETEEFLLNNYTEKAWILRFAPVYSMKLQLNIDRRIKLGDYFFKVGNGGKKISLCNMENIGLVVKAILEEKVPPGIYNISDKVEYTYNDLLENVDTNFIVSIPIFLLKGLYYIGKIMNNIFLMENTIKLVTDNTFPSNKIREYVELHHTLKSTSYD